MPNKQTKKHIIEDITRGRYQSVINLKPPTKKITITVVGFLIIISVITGIFWQGGRSQAELAKFYPSNCLGNWINPSSAEGEPELSLGTEFNDFSGIKAAFYDGGNKQLFCGGFNGNIPARAEFRQATLKIVWAKSKKREIITTFPPDEVVEQIIETPSDSDDTISTSTDVVATSTEDVTDEESKQDIELEDNSVENIKDSNPEQNTAEENNSDNSEELEEISFWQKIFPQARAQDNREEETSEQTEIDQEIIFLEEDNNTTSTDTVSSTVDIDEEIIFDNSTTSSEVTTLRATTTATSTTSIEPDFIDDGSVGDKEIDSEDLFVIKYSLDGYFWQELSRVSFNNWPSEFELPLDSLADLSSLQISIESLPAAEDNLVVLLDGMYIEVSYEKSEFDKSDLIDNINPVLLTNDKKIDFVYTDENTDENLIIKTNNETYVGLTRTEVYFSVTNIGDENELVNLQIHFPKDKGEVKKIEKWEENVPYEIDIPEYGQMDYSCEEGWKDEDINLRSEEEQAMNFNENEEEQFDTAEFKKDKYPELQIIEGVDKYHKCASLNEIKHCDSLSKDNKNCIIEKVQIGSHKDKKYKRDWQNIELSDVSLDIDQGVAKKILGKGIKIKPIPQDLKVEKSSVQGYEILPGETQYFKMEIIFPLKSQGEFYIEAIGDKNGYGLLDPWWNSSWDYKKPITITYSGSALTDYQVKIVTDTASLISASKMQSDCDDIRILDSDEGSGDELNYWIDSDTCNTTSTIIWAKVPAITGDKTIYMYYGNASATEGKNGANTFIFFDDFSGTSLDSKWTATSAGNVTVNNGVRINAGSIYTNSTVTSTPQNKIFEMKDRYHNGTASYSGINIANAQSTSGSNGGSNALAYNMTQSGSSYYLTLWGANGTTASYNIVSGGNLGTPTLNTDYISGFSFYGSSQMSYFYQNTSYTDINRLTYTGTWNQAFYLWLGYFTGSSSGSVDIDDITVRWVRVRQYSATEPTTAVGSETGYANVLVNSFETQSASLTIPSTNQYVGGGFTIDDNSGSSNVTGITITENGTVNAQTNLANIKLYYDLDTSSPYNCASESYGGGESQFGSTTTFNGADGTASFTGTVGVNTTQTMCVYVVLDVGSGASNNETLEIKINNPSTDVTVSSGTVGPSSAVEISGTTTLNSPSDLQQIHYRWRNDDGSESGNDPVWWNSSWGYRKEITIDYTKIDDDLTNFPVLIDLASDSDLATDAQNDGDDIVFTDVNNNKLDHEIKNFNSSTGAIEVYVEAPSISSSTDTSIYMYYGNAVSANQENVTGVWSNDFAMVYHLDELSGTSGSGSVVDSTNNANGTPSTGISFGQSGKIGSSVDFSSGTGINCGSLGSSLLTASTTISFWINATNYASPSRQNPFDQAYGGWGTMTLETSGAINWYFGSNGGNGSPYIGAGSSGGLVSNGAWIYITAVRNPSDYTYKWYKNGAYSNGSTYSSSYPVINTRTFTMGDGYVNPINGKMDEFRVSSVVRSVAWISAEYENQNSPASFYSLGSEESQGTSATFTLNEDITLTSLVKASSTRLRFEISNEGGQTASNVTYRLEVSEPNPSTCAAGTYERVSTDADWEIATSTYIVDGVATQNIVPGLTDANATFVAGQSKDTGDQTSGITLVGITEFTELEYSIKATASSTDGATYCFRLTNAGATTNFTYSKYAQVTMAGGGLDVDIVDGSGTPVTTPSSTMSALSLGFGCQTTTGTLGVSYEKIRVSNTTAGTDWTLTIAPNITTDTWSTSTPFRLFDFNDSTSSGCTDGGDTDGVGGQLTIDPTAGTITPEGGCASTGITKGSSASFVEGSTDTITLLNASSAETDCYWDFTGIDTSQTVPLEQEVGGYNIDLVLTITAS